MSSARICTGSLVRSSIGLSCGLIDFGAVRRCRGPLYTLTRAASFRYDVSSRPGEVFSPEQGVAGEVGLSLVTAFNRNRPMTSADRSPLYLDDLRIGQTFGGKETVALDTASIKAYARQ